MCPQNHTFVVTGLPGLFSRISAACQLLNSITLSEAKRL